MGIVYAVALMGVIGMVLAAMVEGIRSVGGQPVWESAGVAKASALSKPALTVMQVGDRRKQRLPFVGVDRRKTATAEVRKFG